VADGAVQIDTALLSCSRLVRDVGLVVAGAVELRLLHSAKVAAARRLHPSSVVQVSAPDDVALWVEAS